MDVPGKGRNQTTTLAGWSGQRQTARLILTINQSSLHPTSTTMGEIALEPGRTWVLRDFDIGRPLGKGALGKVYLARLRSSDFILALKVLDRAAIMANERAETQARREIEVMRALRHPNIVRLYDFFAEGDRLVLMLEYAAQGEMYRQLAKRGRFSERRSCKVRQSWNASQL